QKDRRSHEHRRGCKAVASFTRLNLPCIGPSFKHPPGTSFTFQAAAKLAITLFAYHRRDRRARRSPSVKCVPKRTNVYGTSRVRRSLHFFRALARNSNKAFVAGSSGSPRSALILPWFVSRAPNTVTGTPASFSKLPNRCACALVSGCSATCRIRNGGIPL